LPSPALNRGRRQSECRLRGSRVILVRQPGSMSHPFTRFEPMSVARHLRDQARPRTEVDVAADAIVAILDARIVPFTPEMIGRLSMVTGRPVPPLLARRRMSPKLPFDAPF
jgi:hypothetical protein